MNLKIHKLVLCLGSLFLLTSCSFFENIFDFISGGDDDSEETTSEDDDSYVPPIKITALDATDTKTTYYTNEIFDTSNQLQVVAHYDDGTSQTIQKGDGYTGYRYTMKNNQNKIVETNVAFGNTGTYKLTVEFNWVKAVLDIEVAQFVPSGNPTSIDSTLSKTTYTMGEYLDLSGYQCTVNYSSESYYANSSSLSIYNLSLHLYNPSNASKNLDAPLDQLGTWRLVTQSSAVSSLNDEIEITVEEPAALTKTEIKYDYNNYNKDSFYNTDICPTKGSPRLLIIPVWLNDSGNYINSSLKSNVKADIETAYLGSTSSTGWHSVKSFYETESHGAMTLNAVVTDWYSYNKNSAEITQNDTVLMVTTLSDQYFTNTVGVDRRDFDSDSNGFLDGVMLIYGAPDFQALNQGNENLWAYCFWVQTYDANKASPCANVFFWASYDFMYSSSKATTRTGYGYGNGDTSHCSIDAHTYIHEMGHVFGLVDYYDYNGVYSPAGGFSMQDSNVGGHDPFSVMALGWANPYIPTISTTLEIGEFTSTGDLILLTPTWNAYDSAFDEYLLLELYAPTGLNELDTNYIYKYPYTYPQGPNAVGLRIWHIDARLTDYHPPGDNDYSNSRLFNKYMSGVCNYGITLAMSNTYYSDDPDNENDRVSGFGSDYNVVQLIRNNTSTTYKPTLDIVSNDLFKNNSQFNISTFSNQFVKGTKLNNGVEFPWSFSVSITGTGTSARATVTLTRN